MILMIDYLIREEDPVVLVAVSRVNPRVTDKVDRPVSRDVLYRYILK